MLFDRGLYRIDKFKMYPAQSIDNKNKADLGLLGSMNLNEIRIGYLINLSKAMTDCIY